MGLPKIHGAQAREIWRRLSAVTDLELDEPITERGMVERLEVRRGEVEIAFRLPGTSRSPNVAFLMADGIRRAALEPAWVSSVRVQLLDHCHAERVNAAINEDRAFAAVFAEECEGVDLSELRETFREHAFLRRQEAVIRGLSSKGWSDEEITSLTLSGFDAVNLCSHPDAAAQKPRYREILVADGLACLPGDPVFVTWAGDRLLAEQLQGHLTRLRKLRINMELNGAPGRDLDAVRYDERDPSGEEPELIDFILGRVPPRRYGASPHSPS